MNFDIFGMLIDIDSCSDF